MGLNSQTESLATLTYFEELIFSAQVMVSLGSNNSFIVVRIHCRKKGLAKTIKNSVCVCLREGAGGREGERDT